MPFSPRFKRSYQFKLWLLRRHDEFDALKNEKRLIGSFFIQSNILKITFVEDCLELYIGA